jgi:bifunctional non-homologous end joining protein LigD
MTAAATSAFARPMLAERWENEGEADAQAFLSKPRHQFELKLDGARVLARVDPSEVTLWYRSGRPAAKAFSRIAREIHVAVAQNGNRLVELVAKHAPHASATVEGPLFELDGELVAFDAEGRPSFDRLSEDLHRDQGAPSTSAVAIVFDVTVAAGRDLRPLPLSHRRALLDAWANQTSLFGSWVKLHSAFNDGMGLDRLCREHGLEGIVRKSLDSPYVGARSSAWQKFKYVREDAFWVIGYTEGVASRKELGALVLVELSDVPTGPSSDRGFGVDGRIVGKRIVGKVGSGFSVATIRELRKLLGDPSKAAIAPFNWEGEHVIPAAVPFRVRVQYERFSPNGHLVKPVFRGRDAE